jgi:hypothetical protein
MGKLMTEMKYEIKEEIVKEVRKENEKIRKELKIERLPATLHKEINDNLGLTFDPTKIVAMHRIPGKQGAPRPILLNFFKNGL